MRRLVITLLLLCLLAGCSETPPMNQEESPNQLTVYSGRNERLIGPLLDRFTEASGIDVQVRYGSTSELVAMLLEEGAYTGADVFISQDAAALGALSEAGMLVGLPGEVTARVAPRFRSPRDEWVGLSGRARVVVYNTERLSPDDLPQSLDQVCDERYKGRFGIAPANASAQAHLALYLALNGEDGLTRLLECIVTNEPQRYPKNTPIVEAVIAGEIDWGLVNHYYLWRALKENPDAPARNFFMPAGDASSFINMAGAGVLGDNPSAVELVRFLLTDEGQRYFAEETFEYPLVPGIAPSVELPPLEQLVTPQIDYRDVSAALEPTLAKIEASGLLQY